ncbi:hypothetical protein [Nocardia wallacei]|nr:hypothetical protein [Nocardia wallacei]
MNRVLVTGMPGVGKSSLLDELFARTGSTPCSRRQPRQAATLEVVTTVPVARVADIVVAHVS